MYLILFFPGLELPSPSTWSNASVQHLLTSIQDLESNVSSIKEKMVKFLKIIRMVMIFEHLLETTETTFQLSVNIHKPVYLSRRTL